MTTLPETENTTIIYISDGKSFDQHLGSQELSLPDAESYMVSVYNTTDPVNSLPQVTSGNQQLIEAAANMSGINQSEPGEFFVTADENFEYQLQHEPGPLPGSEQLDMVGNMETTSAGLAPDSENVGPTVIVEYEEDLSNVKKGKILAKHTFEKSVYTLPLNAFCSCSPDVKGEEIPEEQVFVKDGNMLRLVNVGILKLGHLTFYGFNRNDNWYISTDLFLRDVGGQLKRSYQQALKCISTQHILTLEDNEFDLLKQKSQLKSTVRYKSLISLKVIRDLSKFIETCIPDGIVYQLAHEPYYKKTSCGVLKCARCALTVQKPEMQDIFIPLEEVESKTFEASAELVENVDSVGHTFILGSEPDITPETNTPTPKPANEKLICNVGVLSIQEVGFICIELKAVKYVSIKDLVGHKLFGLVELQRVLTAIKYKPICAPIEVDDQLAKSQSHVTNTLWLDLKTLLNISRNVLKENLERNITKTVKLPRARLGMLSAIDREELTFLTVQNIMYQDTIALNSTYTYKIDAGSMQHASRNTVYRSFFESFVIAKGRKTKLVPRHTVQNTMSEEEISSTTTESEKVSEESVNKYFTNTENVPVSQEVYSGLASTVGLLGKRPPGRPPKQSAEVTNVQHTCRLLPGEYIVKEFEKFMEFISHDDQISVQATNVPHISLTSLEAGPEEMDVPEDDLSDAPSAVTNQIWQTPKPPQHGTDHQKAGTSEGATPGSGMKSSTNIDDACLSSPKVHGRETVLKNSPKQTREILQKMNIQETYSDVLKKSVIVSLNKVEMSEDIGEKTELMDGDLVNDKNVRVESMGQTSHEIDKAVSTGTEESENEGENHSNEIKIDNSKTQRAVQAVDITLNDHLRCPRKMYAIQKIKDSIPESENVPIGEIAFTPNTELASAENEPFHQRKNQPTSQHTSPPCYTTSVIHEEARITIPNPSITSPSKHTGFPLSPVSANKIARIYKELTPIKDLKSPGDHLQFLATVAMSAESNSDTESEGQFLTVWQAKTLTVVNSVRRVAGLQVLPLDQPMTDTLVNASKQEILDLLKKCVKFGLSKDSQGGTLIRARHLLLGSSALLPSLFPSDDSREKKQLEFLRVASDLMNFHYGLNGPNPRRASFSPSSSSEMTASPGTRIHHPVVNGNTSSPYNQGQPPLGNVEYPQSPDCNTVPSQVINNQSSDCNTINSQLSNNKTVQLPQQATLTNDINRYDNSSESAGTVYNGTSLHESLTQPGHKVSLSNNDQQGADKENERCEHNETRGQSEQTNDGLKVKDMETNIGKSTTERNKEKSMTNNSAKNSIVKPEVGEKQRPRGCRSKRMVTADVGDLDSSNERNGSDEKVDSGNVADSCSRGDGISTNINKSNKCKEIKCTSVMNNEVHEETKTQEESETVHSSAHDCEKRKTKKSSAKSSNKHLEQVKLSTVQRKKDQETTVNHQPQAVSVELNNQSVTSDLEVKSVSGIKHKGIKRQKDIVTEDSENLYDTNSTPKQKKRKAEEVVKNFENGNLGEGDEYIVNTPNKYLRTESRKILSPGVEQRERKSPRIAHIDGQCMSPVTTTVSCEDLGQGSGGKVDEVRSKDTSAIKKDNPLHSDMGKLPMDARRDTAVNRRSVPFVNKRGVRAVNRVGDLNANRRDGSNVSGKDTRVSIMNDSPVCSSKVLFEGIMKNNHPCVVLKRIKFLDDAVKGQSLG